MKRAFLLAVAVCIVPAPALSQSEQGCRTKAQFERDQCMRQTSGDNVADRRCMEEYLRELDRCRRLGNQRQGSSLSPSN